MDFHDEERWYPPFLVRNNPPSQLSDTSGRPDCLDRLAGIKLFSEVGSDSDQDIDLNLDDNWENYMRPQMTGLESGLQNAILQFNYEPHQSTWNMDSIDVLMNMHDDQPLDFGQQHALEGTTTLQFPSPDFQIQTFPSSSGFQNQLLMSSNATPHNPSMPSSFFDLEAELHQPSSVNLQPLSHPPSLIKPRSHFYPSSQTNPRDQLLLISSNDPSAHLSPLSVINAEPGLPPNSQVGELFEKESYQAGILGDGRNWSNLHKSWDMLREFPGQPDIEAAVLAYGDTNTFKAAGRAEAAPQNKGTALNSKRKGDSYGVPYSKRARTMDCDESNGGFFMFSFKVDVKASHQEFTRGAEREPTRPRTANVCIRCKILRRKVGRYVRSTLDQDIDFLRSAKALISHAAGASTKNAPV